MAEAPGGERRGAREAEAVARFVREVGRTRRRGLDSNDRQYDRGVEARVRPMAPEELDRVLREEEG